MFRVKRSILAVFRRFRSDRVLKSTDHSESGLTLVALVVSERDRALLSHLAAKHRWVIHFARTGGEAWEILNARKAQIILCEREVAGAEWRDVIRKMVSAPHLVCAILISRVTDDYLWNEVVSWGGHDVLATPLHEENVLRAIRLAWLYWNSARKYNAGVA
jgi:DNA-binding response OmpR family regulator